jgi:hypothetical protein
MSPISALTPVAFALTALALALGGCGRRRD